MMVKFLGFVLGVIVISLGAYMLYYQFTTPKNILKYGSVTAKSQNDPNRIQRVRTRLVDQGGIEFWEVELPAGVWLPCEINCADTYRRAKLDFWKTRQEEDRR